MALSGPEKGNPLTRESSDAERFSSVGGVAPDGTIAPISVGSKLKSPATRYRECLKNHAANIGGNITDGCGEFMAGGEDGTLEALKCAACNCHRNFHRKEDADFARFAANPLQLLPPPLPSPSLNLHHHWTSINLPPVKMATDSSSEELNFNAAAQPAFAVAKKRFRTKFTQEQKDKLLGFAEKVGWRIPREDDAEVQRFCAEIGVKRHVLKVWMHNNKNPLKKQLQEPNGD